jgi:hypothetical protein
MKKLIAAAILLNCATPALAGEFYIILNQATNTCTVMEGRPPPGGGLVLGARHIDRGEAESRMKTIRLCNQPSKGSPGASQPR